MKGALYDIPPNTLCADGCNEIVGMESFVRVGADQFYIPGHELNAGNEGSKHPKSGLIQWAKMGLSLVVKMV